MEKEVNARVPLLAWPKLIVHASAQTTLMDSLFDGGYAQTLGK
jgi:hypothetical protein